MGTSMGSSVAKSRPVNLSRTRLTMARALVLRASGSPSSLMDTSWSPLGGAPLTLTREDRDPRDAAAAAASPSVAAPSPSAAPRGFVEDAASLV